jgi:hypothetical protein
MKKGLILLKMGFLSLILSSAVMAEQITRIRDNGFQWKDLNGEEFKVDYPNISWVKKRIFDSRDNFQISNKKGVVLNYVKPLSPYVLQGASKALSGVVLPLLKVVLKNENWIVYNFSGKSFFITEKKILENTPEINSIEDLLESKKIISCLEDLDSIFFLKNDSASNVNFFIKSDTGEKIGFFNNSHSKKRDLQIQAGLENSVQTMMLFSFAVNYKMSRLAPFLDKAVSFVKKGAIFTGAAVLAFIVVSVARISFDAAYFYAYNDSSDPDYEGWVPQQNQ